MRATNLGLDGAGVTEELDLVRVNRSTRPREVRSDDLPAKARDYVLRLEELGGAYISCIGVGPGREQTIVRRDVLAARP